MVQGSAQCHAGDGDYHKTPLLMYEYTLPLTGMHIAAAEVVVSLFVIFSWWTAVS